jgi:prepilin-type N-terminal cleavage/methylation domain-containing protein
MKNIFKRGFTLIELLVVIAIIGILITVGSVSYQRAVRLSRDSKRKTDLEQIRQALETYRSENGTYPDSTAWEGDLESGYIAIVPQDITNPYTYTPGPGLISYDLCATLESVTPDTYCVTQP